MVSLVKYPQVKVKPYYCGMLLEELRKANFKGLFIYDYASEILYITDSIILKKVNEGGIPHEYVTNPNSIEYIISSEDDEKG